MEFIAEVGSNWYHPDKNLAKQRALKHIETASHIGATIVKFQLFTAKTLYSQARAPDIFERAKKHELPIEWISELANYAYENNVSFWLSVFDTKLLLEVSKYLDGIKIASGDITNFPLLLLAAQTALKLDIPLAISTGASKDSEIQKAIKITDAVADVLLFHCKSIYPLPINQSNLLEINLLKKYHTTIGFSDHTPGNISTPAILALTLGCEYFEKHFTIDKETDSPDLIVSATPDEFENYCLAIRSAQEVLGIERKVISPDEEPERQWARRSSDDWLRPAYA